VRNIAHELGEVMLALGADAKQVGEAVMAFDNIDHFPCTIELNAVRDGLVDINVFSYGAHHLMGINADLDMEAVIEGIMSRFIKAPDDKLITIDKHAAKGVTDVYFEGAYPTMVMKSGSDQPDAPKGKFLKSASYKEPVFYKIVPAAPVQAQEPAAKSLGAFDAIPGI
jgi:hypothetical protein